MRTAFIETLYALAEQNERIWLVCADLGYSVVEQFSARFPDRFVNVGVAEQHMTGLAAGLALSGKIVFTYSIANFPVMRCLEQIRNDVCYHNLPVKIVAVGGGLAYGAAGYSHHGVEDLAVMRVMPNMTVVAPGDPAETRLATRAIVDCPGPCYLRLGKAGEAHVHQTDPLFVLGRAIEIQAGTDLAILSTGGMLETVVRAATQLQEYGHSVMVLSVPTIVPLDVAAIERAALTGRILTVEEHGPGGLGSVVAEVLVSSPHQAHMRSLRLGREPISVAGSQAYLRTTHNLSVTDVTGTAIEMLGRPLRTS